MTERASNPGNAYPELEGDGSPREPEKNEGIRRILNKMSRALMRRRLSVMPSRWASWQPRLAATLKQIRTGMSGRHALEELGNPDDMFPFAADDEGALTLWVYDRREEPVYLWVDDSGTVKMTCRTHADRHH